MFWSLRALRESWSTFRAPRALAGVLAPRELEHIFQQERCRADRSGNCVAMVVFELEGSLRRLPELARLLREHMRLYDTLGRLDDRRLALLLPESDGQGAARFGDRIAAACTQLGMKLQREVFAYPVDGRGLDGDGGAGRSARRYHLRIAEAGEPEETGLPAGEDQESPSPPGRTLERTGTDGELRAEMGGFPLTLLRPLEDRRPVYDLALLFARPMPFGKRAFDVLVAGVLLLALSPLLAIAALAVKWTSPGPAIFRQRRAGFGGRPFVFLKFRSMYVDAEERLAALKDRNIHRDGPIFKDPRDPRITPVGRFLRKYSIDELPQLVNVLRGDMTLIGPRPPKLDEVEAYEPWQRRRLEVLGGLTCIWQVSGRSEIGFKDWMRMDIQYVRRRSPLLDAKLLLKTFRAVLSARGAY